jgi:hypothetical protein
MTAFALASRKFFFSEISERIRRAKARMRALVIFCRMTHTQNPLEFNDLSMRRLSTGSQRPFPSGRRTPAFAAIYRGRNLFRVDAMLLDTRVRGRPEYKHVFGLYFRC